MRFILDASKDFENVDPAKRHTRLHSNICRLPEMSFARDETGEEVRSCSSGIPPRREVVSRKPQIATPTPIAEPLSQTCRGAPASPISTRRPRRIRHTGAAVLGFGGNYGSGTPNLPTKLIPTKIC